MIDMYASTCIFVYLPFHQMTLLLLLLLFNVLCHGRSEFQRAFGGEYSLWRTAELRRAAQRAEDQAAAARHELALSVSNAISHSASNCSSNTNCSDDDGYSSADSRGTVASEGAVHPSVPLRRSLFAGDAVAGAAAATAARHVSSSNSHSSSIGGGAPAPADWRDKDDEADTEVTYLSHDDDDMAWLGSGANDDTTCSSSSNGKNDGTFAKGQQQQQQQAIRQHEHLRPMLSRDELLLLALQQSPLELYGSRKGCLLIPLD
jgi:hypothetical protein